MSELLRRLVSKNSKWTRLISRTTLISSSLLIGLSINSQFDCMAQPQLHSSVYTWGFNRYGQLGVGSESNENSPKCVSALNGIIKVSSGAEQTAAITENGKLYTFGRSQDSRLGHGGTSGSNETSPRLVRELNDKSVVDIDAGYSHMGCVTADGQVWTWGKNTHHQLGHSQFDYPNAVQLLIDLGVIATKVACGRYHTVVLANDGAVYAWGGFKSGECGTGNRKTTAEPTRVSSLGNSKIVDVCAGQDFTLFLSESGDVYSCGACDQGQTGNGSSTKRCHCTPNKIQGLSNVCAIAAGQFHSICACTDGNVYTFGLNREGQLGHGDTQNRTVPTQILALSNEHLKVIDVAAGGGHSACIVWNENTKCKQLYIFGRGRQGQIGRANNVESVAAYRDMPVIVDFFDQFKNADIVQVDLGNNHSAALLNQ